MLHNASLLASPDHLKGHSNIPYKYLAVKIIFEALNKSAGASDYTDYEMITQMDLQQHICVIGIFIGVIRVILISY